VKINYEAIGPAQNIVVIAGSVGGVEALSVLTGNLPANLKAAVVVAQHVSRNRPSQLAEILSRRTPMPVKQVADGDRLCHSCIFVAPSNEHVLIELEGILRLSSSPRIHFTRPSAEPLFCSAAAVYGKKVIGVVLTGSDADASLCVQVIGNVGGKVIVQDETTSADFSMPRSAIQTGKVNFVLPLTKIGSAIVELVVVS
jgi:two-component system, chemotaxis family, protein-glutamate methylesterase/glutaminase